MTDRKKIKDKSENIPPVSKKSIDNYEKIIFYLSSKGNKSDRFKDKKGKDKYKNNDELILDIIKWIKKEV